MNEHRVKGLSCPSCAASLEQQIQQLEHGDNAVLSYNSGVLRVDSRVSLQKVEQILKSDGAWLVKEANTAHSNNLEQTGSRSQSGHSHGHLHSEQAHDDHNHQTIKMRNLVIGASLLYALALMLENQIAAPAVTFIFLAAMAISGYTTFLRGLRNLFKLKFTMDTLMTIALIGAVAIGEWKEATLVAILFGLNEMLEGMGMEKARRSMASLLEVAPKEAVVVEQGVERIVPIASLAPGMIVKVKPGEKIPSDGVITEGKSSVNEAAITGESLPVDKAAGAKVFGGSLNNEGVLQIRIEKAYEDSSLAKILHLVKEAQDTKTPTELFINRFAKYYTPMILLLSVMIMLVPPLLFNGEWGHWLYQGLAVLIVGCPCALILSSPIAIVSGITRSARNGILVKGGAFLEQLGKIDTIAFDKTGTLTKGQPYVEEVAAYEEEEFYRAAYAIEHSSSHPLAKAIVRKLRDLQLEAEAPEEFTTISGQGIRAVIQGKSYSLGNEKAVQHLTLPQPVRQKISELKEKGLTLVIVADEAKVLGMFGIADEIREESREVVTELHRQGIRQTVMLTGDHRATAEKVASAVGVRAYYSSLLPEQKVEHIRELSGQGKVAMIGDGINDAPALAAAQLGIAMGKGTDSAIETADIVLMQDHLGKLPEAVQTAKKVNRIIRFNIAISLGLKLIALLLTIPGWLTLWIAILSDMGATILVTLISLTILLERKPRSKALPAAH
ncbi:heavy metal translocating P-type ATPase [Paenibacillus senegalensis]|uniref:heavy metal translocating P-type ATPase n=1 Tax=Paenibacillus senegalensis TaxID=1465766 RepID=UPI000289F337|nr:heavy metal translocating P-type ATPase [Paenibacillus senegalensis]